LFITTCIEKQCTRPLKGMQLQSIRFKFLFICQGTSTRR